MRRRFGSADSVVLPVPESPKKSVTSRLAPTFAAQCIGSTSLAGSRKFWMPNIAFFISPAYRKPASRTRRRSKLSITATSPRVPSRAGEQTKFGALTTSQTSLAPGLKVSGTMKSE